MFICKLLHIHMQRYINIDTQTHSHTDRQTYRDTDIQTARHTDTQTHGQTHIQTYRQTARQTHIHTNIQTDRHTHTHTHTHTHKHTHTQICFFSQNVSTGEALLEALRNIFSINNYVSIQAVTYTYVERHKGRVIDRQTDIQKTRQPDKCIHGYTDIQLQSYTSTKYTDTEIHIHRYMNTPLHSYTSTQLHICTATHINPYTNKRIRIFTQIHI